MSLVSIFADARPYVQLFMALLAAAALAALVVWLSAAVRAKNRDQSARGSAALAAIAAGLRDNAR